MGDTKREPGAHISVEQKRRLVEAYQSNGGNMTAAMHTAGIASRKTAYLWWHRYQLGGDEALQPRSQKRKHQNQTAPNLVKQIHSLRRDHASWGRRRIAAELAKRSGRQVISPGAVEAVLRRAGLWMPERGNAEIRDVMPYGGVGSASLDLDALFAEIRLGLTASLSSDAQRAATILYHQVWVPLGGLQHIPRELREPAKTRQILRASVQLGHSLMNAGDWRWSALILEQTLAWMLEHEEELRAREREGTLLGFRLRWDDLWLECHQYLGIVLRDADTDMAVGRLNTARETLRRHDARGRSPTNRKGTLANIERDFATVLLRHPQQAQRDARERIARHLMSARELDQEAGAIGMQAATEMKWAEFYSFQAAGARQSEPSMLSRHLDNVQALADQALRLVAREQSPILHTKLSIDAAKLYTQNGIPLESARLISAAENCLTFGYAAQAVALLHVANVEDLLPSELLARLRSAFGTDSRTPSRPWHTLTSQPRQR
jgi:transposase-like protein